MQIKVSKIRHMDYHAFLSAQFALVAVFIHDVSMLKLDNQIPAECRNIFISKLSLFLLFFFGQAFGLGLPRQFIDALN